MADASLNSTASSNGMLLRVAVLCAASGVLGVGVGLAITSALKGETPQFAAAGGVIAVVTLVGLAPSLVAWAFGADKFGLSMLATGVLQMLVAMGLAFALAWSLEKTPKQALVMGSFAGSFATMLLQAGVAAFAMHKLQPAASKPSGSTPLSTTSADQPQHNTATST